MGDASRAPGALVLAPPVPSTPPSGASVAQAALTGVQNLATLPAPPVPSTPPAQAALTSVQKLAKPEPASPEPPSHASSMQTASPTGVPNLAQSVRESNADKRARVLADHVAVNKISDAIILQSGDDAVEES
jgi:hypothetical protein